MTPMARANKILNLGRFLIFRPLAFFDNKQTNEKKIRFLILFILLVSGESTFSNKSKTLPRGIHIDETEGKTFSNVMQLRLRLIDSSNEYPLINVSGLKIVSKIFGFREKL